MNPAFAWRIGGDGCTALAGELDHLRQMIEQLVLTSAGERVNRPDFGGGLYQLAFAPNGPQLAATLQFTLQAGVQRYLADVIDVGALSVTADEERLLVALDFQLRSTAAVSAATVEVPLGGA